MKLLSFSAQCVPSVKTTQPHFSASQNDATIDDILLVKPGQETMTDAQLTAKNLIDAFVERAKDFLTNPPKEDSTFFEVMANLVPTMRHVVELEEKLGLNENTDIAAIMDHLA